jgi:predicted methyltransferase
VAPTRSILIRLVALAVAVGLVFVGYDALQALSALERIESERDTWQRPDDIIRALALKKGDQVVDFGSGAGYLSLRLAPVVGPEGRIIAVDLRRISLAFLMVRAWQRGYGQIETVVGDAQRAVLPRGPFDAVLIVNTYHELTNRRDILGQLYNPLIPGGRLVVADRRRRDQQSASTSADDHDAGHTMDPARAEAELRAAGFDVLSRNDTWIDRPGDEPWWLIVCRNLTRRAELQFGLADGRLCSPSRARLSSSTFTRGSPKNPNCRPSV